MPLRPTQCDPTQRQATFGNQIGLEPTQPYLLACSTTLTTVGMARPTEPTQLEWLGLAIPIKQPNTHASLQKAVSANPTAKRHRQCVRDFGAPLKLRVALRYLLLEFPMRRHANLNTTYLGNLIQAEQVQ